ncbi:ArgE/DapE family deacylase [Candidatus Formimonas warabiya]|uniref:Peptidase M20 dimerisation domain-containing protein n=1 Tax=Formimonas warabiya TaxID=1761012 RepID=A0A3G1KV48_FORW1|nr:ArgE/DapE family deacylase [Candidatus Formimonas warabiya]ATW26287.1 hypothetical protein DCMF_17330 [Candidatus Formimonas warabiya]
MNGLEQKISQAVDSLKEEMIEFIQQLMAYPSLTGQEEKVQMVVAEKLKSLGLEVDAYYINFDQITDHPAFCDDGVSFGNRLNVIGRWKPKHGAEGPKKGKAGSLILNGHMDVVSPGNEQLWQGSPWQGRIAHGKLYGRGSCDMKSGFAAAIFAIKALQKIGFSPLGEVMIQSVVGEETGGAGTLANIAKGYKADAAIILEPTQLKICPVQSGALSFRIKVRGRSIHACMKNKGISAIDKFYLIFDAINTLEYQRHHHYRNDLYDDPKNIAPICFGTIKGGDWPSTVPDELVAEGRYGIFPGESPGAAKALFEETVKHAAEKDDWLKENLPVVEWFEGQFESGITDIHEPIIKTLSEAHRCILGQDPEIRGVTYGSDLRLFTNHAGIPAILYGPGNVENAHAVNEWISLDEIFYCMNVIALTICQWCGE